MGRKLYGKNIEKKCGYCAIGDTSDDGRLVFCPKKGIVEPDYHCRRFVYDPIRRVPRPAPEMDEYSAKDFEI